MKNEIQNKRTPLNRFLRDLAKNLAALFESSEMRDFRKLKNFIGS